MASAQLCGLQDISIHHRRVLVPSEFAEGVSLEVSKRVNTKIIVLCTVGCAVL
jgi:hypothetical protein